MDDETDDKRAFVSREQLQTIVREIDDSHKVIKEIIARFEELEEAAKANATAAKKLSQTFAKINLDSNSEQLMQELFLGAEKMDTYYANSLGGLVDPLRGLNEVAIPASWV